MDDAFVLFPGAWPVIRIPSFSRMVPVVQGQSCRGSAVSSLMFVMSLDGMFLQMLGAGLLVLSLSRAAFLSIMSAHGRIAR